ncbi:hypothetical protein STIUS_v1c02580 [Spiroplasma sp. TIUS-1]|nr:hypothetical protein STIUS_v1c02580 [Spiroplasma sp. TIUS-1]
MKKFWKLTRFQNKLLFVILGISVVVAPTGAIIYSFTTSSSYSIKDPWADASDLNKSLDKYFNDKLSPTRTTFRVGETQGTGIYVKESDITDIRKELINGNEWMSKMSEADLNEMLSGTGVSISENNKLIFNDKEMKELALFPTILKYPYEGNNKLGEVFFSPSNKEAGIFKYNIRFCLRLGIVGFDNKKYDLKKKYDFTLRHDQETTLPVLLKLINNESIQKFIQVNESFNSNESVLKGLLKTYYNLANNSGMDFYSEIKPKSGSLPANNKYAQDYANASSIHIKYDSRKINNIKSFGSNLYNQHLGDYNTVEYIFNKIGISMPKIENDITGFRLRDRNSGSWTSMSSSDIKTYKGYINYGYSDGKEITDDVENSLFQSEHKIFTNKVNIKFLDVNKSTDIYYDQQPYSRGSINYNNYNIVNDVNDVVNNIKYEDSRDLINQKLSSKQNQIEQSIVNTIKKSLDSNGVSQSVFDEVRVSSPMVSNIATPGYATRKDNDKVYFDKTIDFNRVDSKAFFYSEGRSVNRITQYHFIPSKVINDPYGKAKYNLSSLNISNIPNNLWDTDTYESEIIYYVKNLMRQSIDSWPNKFKPGNEANEMSYKLNGPIKGGKLNEGSYTVTITAPNSLWNFKGSKTTNTFYVKKKSMLE